MQRMEIVYNGGKSYFHVEIFDVSLTHLIKRHLKRRNIHWKKIFFFFPLYRSFVLFQVTEIRSSSFIEHKFVCNIVYIRIIFSLRVQNSELRCCCYCYCFFQKSICQYEKLDFHVTFVMKSGTESDVQNNIYVKKVELYDTQSVRNVFSSKQLLFFSLSLSLLQWNAVFNFTCYCS